MAVINYIWDELSDNVQMETDENDVPTVVYTHRPERFGELISQERSGVTSYYSYDGQHSTRLLTDDNENITDTYIFSAFGELVARTGTTINPFGYKGAVGYYSNSATGDIYVRARTYEPVIGRWLSMDPLGFVDGPNLYRAYFVPNGVDTTGQKLVIPSINPDKRELIAGWLNQLCPSGKFKVRSDGSVYSYELGFCNTETGYDLRGCSITVGPSYGCSDRPISCGCICQAINSDCVISLWDGPRPSIFGPSSAKVDRGGGITRFYKNCDAEIFIGGMDNEADDDRIIGDGDTNPPADGRVRNPKWLILAHELCGHAVTHLSHKDAGIDAYTSKDPVIIIENIIRQECSTIDDNYGRRRGPREVPVK